MNNLRTGFTTGTCAAAAAKAAVILLTGAQVPEGVEVTLPDRTKVRLSLAYAKQRQNAAEAAVYKDAGDDPDITDGAMVIVSARWNKGDDIMFKAGEGVGTVTLPGLSVSPGEPAINPVPRNIIRRAVREVTQRPVELTVSVPGGREMAKKTFNPRLGIVGGLSILGTEGRVRPFSVEALTCALECSLNIARANGVTSPVFVPGHIGRRAALRHFNLAGHQVVEVSNKWGFMLERAAKQNFEHLLLMGHPGKLAKLADNQWDTHSSASGSAVPVISKLGLNVLGKTLRKSQTVEGVFKDLSENERKSLGNAASEMIRRSVLNKFGTSLNPAIIIVNMAGDVLGSAGDLSPWR